MRQFESSRPEHRRPIGSGAPADLIRKATKGLPGRSKIWIHCGGSAGVAIDQTRRTTEDTGTGELLPEDEDSSFRKKEQHDQQKLLDVKKYYSKK
jgi:hypothetical protein